MALWKRSGQTAAAFAAAHGFSHRSLLWWSSTLRRDGKPVTSPRRVATIHVFEIVLNSSLVVCNPQLTLAGALGRLPNSRRAPTHGSTVFQVTLRVRQNPMEDGCSGAASARASR
jgi:hypothetical protein